MIMQNALKRDRCDTTNVLTSEWRWVSMLNLKWKEKPIKALLAVQSTGAAACRASYAKWLAVHKRKSLLWLSLPAPDLHLSQL